MTWFKIDDALHSHPKWLAASPEARALWVTAGSWCAAHLTDGHVPRHVLTSFAARNRDAAELVRVGLWDEASGGWVFHDWAAFQPSAESVEAERAAARERQRRFRESRRMSRRDIGRESHRDVTENEWESAVDNSRRNTNDTINPDSESTPDNATVSPNRRMSRRDSRREFGPPDPTRPDQDVKGGGSLQTAATTAPPLRCPQHANTEGPVPPCGACADARRTHDAWAREHTNGHKDDPLAGMQAAARQRAEAGTTQAHAIATEPADPQAAAKIANLLREHRLATRKDPA